MSLSFGESLKKNASVSTASVMSISEEPIVEVIEENWQRHPDYVYYDNFSDNNFSIVDDNKNITLGDKQFNITQEENSQYIPFKMARYYDGFDLVNTAIQIHYYTKKGRHGSTKPINVEYSDSNIKFGWLMDAGSTVDVGTLEFEIQAYGSVVGSDGVAKSYVWKTKTNKNLNVLQSLCSHDDVVNEVDNSWVQELIEEVAFKVGEEIKDFAISSEIANEVTNMVGETIDDVLQDKNYATTSYVDNAVASVDVSGQLGDYVKTFDLEANYYNKTEIDNAIADVDVLEQLANYYTKEEVNEYVQTQIDAIPEIDLSGYATKEEIPDVSGFIKEVPAEYITETELNAKGYLTEHQDLSDYALKTEVPSIEGLATENYVDAHIAAIPKVDLTGYATEEYVNNQIGAIPEVDLTGYATEEYVGAQIANIPEVDLTGYATEEYVNNKTTILSGEIDANKTNISSLGTAVGDLQTAVNAIDTSPRLTYDVVYNDVEDPDVGENVFVFYEIENEGVEGEEKREAKKKFTIVGGSGGGATSSSLKIGYVTTSPLVVTVDDKAIIKYTFTGTDSSGDNVPEGQATWKVAGRAVATNTALNGENEFDVTEYLSIGSQKVSLTITDEAGSLVSKTWTVQKIDVRLESTFNDKLTYPLAPVSFDYTPYGAISKDIHFVLDGEEIGKVTTTSSGIPMGFEIPAQEHGSHLLEVYMTATINGNEIESNHIVKDIVWYDETSSIPVIGTVYQDFTARQYDTTNIEYIVYDPTTESPTITIAVDNEVVSTPTLTTSTNIYPYKETVDGVHTITITCGETVKTLTANVEKLNINVAPVTAGLVFDFNPVGKSNNDTDRVWSTDTVAMSVSENFDWTNGGYQIDEKGDQYFCIKAGTSAEIDYQLFADDAKRNGKEMKLVFKTTNVSNPDATFLKCVDNTTDTNHIGVQMDVHEARIYAMSENLPLPYAEDETIEFEFNISKNTEVPAMVMGYEDGVSTRPLVYGDSHNFTQTNPQVISMGSPDCDLHIYRFKVYNTSLTDRGILSNFIADARNAEEMIARYDRNQIYDENGQLTPEVLAEKCPQLRIIKIDTPRFTKDKDDKVGGATIQCIYKNGDPILDNWTAYDCVTSGQGTSSNNYGASGRNLDLIMKTYKNYGNNPYIILGDGKTEVNKVSLTRNSIETNYFNVKVNIASSENANNALLQKRYNEYNPYNRPFVREDETEIPKIKDTMEFQNCVIFVRESDPDLSTHVEFADDAYHFYAMGNIGDSKKTDSSRLTDKDDRYECILEVMDNTLPNSSMPTGKVDENGAPVYPILESEWTVGNSAYDALMAEKFDESKAADKENGLADTYGWRYIYEDGTDEENAEARTYVENKWREFYKFVVTSTDEEFKAHLGDYCVLDSVLFYYLFTLRYTMTDNHAKNSFWHYGKSNDLGEDGIPIRKFDLCFDYDNDTGLGIDNYGRMTYRYGYEEIDYVDGTSDWVWNCPQHVLFLRIRELFDVELCDLYTRLESLGCWSATSLINQFNEWQMQFPEELWRTDIQRKYIRTFTGSFINGEAKPEFLRERANGRKKTQRSQFERNQEKYMASKFGGTTASADDIILRCSIPNAQLAVQPNFDMHLIPYSHIYLNVKYNTSPPMRVRAVPNQEYEIKYDAELADIIEIYSASCLKSIGDLSACYLTNGDFVNASKIRELKLGNDTEGYNNTNVMTLGLGANTLLNKLDIQNMSGLTHALDLTALKNLEELYAHGTNIGGVTFADGGLIEIAELPAINSMTMKNLVYLNNLDVTSFDKLTTLVVENCNSVDLLSVLGSAPNINRIRLVGVDWTLEDTTLLERLYGMSGIDRNGYNVDQSVLTGSVYVPIIRQQQLYDYQKAWSDLEIRFGTMIEQFPVKFVNEDGTILETQYVDKGEDAIDPTTRAENPITPIKESTVSHDFTFAGWDTALNDVFTERIVTATYTSSLRSYTIKYVSKGAVMQESTGLYGENIPYTGVSPTYTAEEAGYVYYLFNRWDKSGFIDGEKTVEAIFDKFEYTATAFDNKELKDLTPVEIYAMNKLNLAEQVITDKDPYTFTIGNDIEYDDIDSELLISEKTIFDGTNHIDTGVQLFDEDKDFTLAIDYEFLTNNKTNAVLAQCFQANGSNGFKLWYGSDYGAKLTWGTVSNNVVPINKREILVIRHKKGDNNLTIYKSNLDGEEVQTANLERNKSTVGTGTLVFGSARADDGLYENHAIGNIYWAKVWYQDLGEDICKSLAMWTHESITLEACGFRKYYLTDNTSKRCSFSLLASHLLGRAKAWNRTNSNIGGWNSSALNASLNNRLYKAMPSQIRELLKQVIVYSSAGNMSSELVPSNCYITIPALIEVDSTKTTEPYNSEGTSISYLTTNASRKRSFDGGDYAEYWTRSPNVGYEYYVYRVDQNGATQGITTPTSSLGVLIEISF